MTTYDALIKLQKVMASLEDDRQYKEDVNDLVKVYKFLIKKHGGMDKIREDHKKTKPKRSKNRD